MITSKDNQYIRLFRDLGKKKFREEYGLFPAEGKRLIRDLTEAGLLPHLLLYAEDFSDYELLEQLASRSDQSYSVEKRIFHQLTETKNEQGIVAAFPLLCPDFSSFHPRKEGMLLILNGVSDPGNLGTILRSAAAADIDAVLMEEGCVDLFNPKVIRATMGTIARIPVFYGLSHETIVDFLLQNDIKTYLADLQNAVCYDRLPLTERVAVVFGNEGNGIGKEWRSHSYPGVMIPMENGVESLNVAMAAGIISFGRYIRQKNLK